MRVVSVEKGGGLEEGAGPTHGYQQGAINVANVRNVKPPTAAVGFAFGPGRNNGAWMATGNWKLN